MKKLSFFLMAMLFSMMSFAAEMVAYTLTTTPTGENKTPHNAYASAAEGIYDGITWNVTGNSAMEPWRIGGKSLDKVDRAVYTKTAMAADITKIEITHATVDITCNSCTLTISDAANGSGETFPVKVAENTTTTITLPEGDYSNKFYKLVYNVTNTTNTNKYVQLSEIKFYTEVQTSVEAPTFTPEEGKVAANNTFAEPFALTIASATTDATIKYTLDGTDPTLETALTYEAPITISTMVQVRAIAVKGEEKSVEASVAYIISSSEAKPYTASEAIAAEALGLTGTVYVTGTVKSIEELSTQYGNATYNITDGTKELKIYRGKNLENAKFTSADQLLVGDVVVVKGDLTSYNGAAQLGQNNYLISRSTPVVNHTVTVSANPAEAGTVTGGGEYEETDEITVKAVANDGYEFVNWTEGETVVSTEANYSFEVLADRALVANFIKKTISYELNGGAFPEVKVPTNAELWGTDTADVNGFMHYYNHYYNLKRATQTIENVASFADAQMQQIMTDEASEYKWLGDYVAKVTTDAGRTIDTEVLWRFGVAAFFNCKAEATSTWNGNADFTEAGKPENWGPAYQAAHAVVLPTEPVDAPYTLPTPVKEGYKFVGWYDNAEGTGEPMTVIPAGWDGTLYAIWVEIYTITVEAENGTVEGAGNYEHGAEATLTATPAEGYEFVNWTVDNTEVSKDATYSFEVTENLALVANFKEVEVEHTYTIAGDSDIAFGSAWSCDKTENDMTKQEDGTYKWEKTELTLLEGSISFKICEDHDWGVAYPAENYSLAIPETGIYTITIIFNPATKEITATATKTGDAVVIPSIAMHGNFLGSWADTENFTPAADEATATLTLTIAEGTYEFGMRIGGSGNWTSNGVAFTRDNASAVIEAGSGNLTFTADVAGEYIFTWTFETKTLTITYPAQGPTTDIDNISIDGKTVKTIINNQLIIIKNGVQYNAQGAVVK